MLTLRRIGSWGRLGLVSVVALASLVAYTWRPRLPTARHDRVSVRSPADVVADAHREFELAPAEVGLSTSKLYSRSVFLPLDDPRANSEGDFVGRLRALFGVTAKGGYVLRHRETGCIVTAYSGESGPSYGGAPSCDTEARDARGSNEDAIAASQARAKRVLADPVLAAGRPLDAAKALGSASPDEILRLRERDLAWERRFDDTSAPPGFARAVARLDELLASVPPADWEALRYWEDDPAVYRVGVRRGVVFEENLDAPAGLAYLLSEADRVSEDGGAEGGTRVDGREDARVVAYFLYQAKRGSRVEALLPRVRVSWRRFVTRAVPTSSGEARDRLVRAAREDASALGMDSAEVAAALEGLAR